MSQSVRLNITDAEITDAGILIKSMSVIDGVSGEVLKVAKLTPELLDFLMLCEIDLTNYFAVQEMKAKNPAFTKLVETFKLYT